MTSFLSSNPLSRTVIGFMVIDDDTRYIVIEGLGGPGQGMQGVQSDITSLPLSSSGHSSSSSSSSLKILCDTEILFASRLYSSFG